MADNVIKFKKTDGPVDEVLKDATESDYDKIVIVGWKDGKITVDSSGGASRIEIMGAMLAASIDAWEA